MNEEWSMPDGPLDLYCSEADDQNNGEPTNLWMLLEDALSMQVTLRISVHRYLHIWFRMFRMQLMLVAFDFLV